MKQKQTKKKKTSAVKPVVTIPYPSFAAVHGHLPQDKDEALFEEHYLSLVKKFAAELLPPMHTSSDKKFNVEIMYLQLMEREVFEKAAKSKVKRIDGRFDKDTLQYLSFVPLLTIWERLHTERNLKGIFESFFLGKTEKAPKYAFAPVGEDETEAVTWNGRLFSLFEHLKWTFAAMAEKIILPFVDCQDCGFFIVNDIFRAVEQYVRFFESIGNDEILGQTYKIRTHLNDLFNSCNEILLGGSKDFPSFDLALGNLRSAFQGLPPALYKLECRRYQELSKKTGKTAGKIRGGSAPATKADLNAAARRITSGNTYRKPGPKPTEGKKKQIDAALDYREKHSGCSYRNACIKSFAREPKGYASGKSLYESTRERYGDGRQR